ncbi:MAG: histidine kinase dimerization/phosphoacceptor domain -containing protein [Euryarchaeota archaeon]|nr:histidine kinase dimerization/phosphoacceptor domain -containing protein [Euryarchaeota archaeon]
MERYNIMLVEDDLVDRMAFNRYVKENGNPHDYTVASSVAEAKTLLDSKRFDTVIADYQLGDGTAFDIFETGVDAPIIVVTGAGDEETAVRAMRAGAYDYLVKDPDNNYLTVLQTTVENAVKRWKTERELRQYQSIVECAYDVIFFKDLNSRYVIANDKTAECFGSAREEVIGKDDFELMPDIKEAAKNVEDDKVVFATGEPKEIVKHMTAPNGTEYWFQAIKVPYFDADGKMTGLIGIARNITDRKHAQDRIKAELREKEILLREMHHRVKNDLQVVSSLLNMQAGLVSSEDTAAILSESRDRVNTMVLMHAQLYERGNLVEVNMKEFLDGITRQSFQSYPVRDTRIASVSYITDYPLPVSTAVHIGLILNELLSNVFKHAFAGRTEGKVKVSFDVTGDGKASLTVSDDGAGLPPGFDIDTTGSLGLHLVKILAKDQLQGDIKVTCTEGTTFLITFGIGNDYREANNHGNDI